MKKFGLLLMAMCILLSAGCTTKNGVRMAEVAKEAYQVYQAQPRTYAAVRMVGTNITIAGVTELHMEAPLNPLEAMPRDPDAVARIVDGIKNTVLGGMGIWGLTTMATKDPTIVYQQPAQVVRPEVVQPAVVNPVVVGP